MVGLGLLSSQGSLRGRVCAQTKAVPDQSPENQKSEDKQEREKKAKELQADFQRALRGIREIDTGGMMGISREWKRKWRPLFRFEGLGNLTPSPLLLQ